MSRLGFIWFFSSEQFHCKVTQIICLPLCVRVRYILALNLKITEARPAYIRTINNFMQGVILHHP